MMERDKSYALFVLFALMLVCPSLDATTFARMSVDEMSHAARVIVRAKCLTNRVGWEEGEIWTFTTFQIAETWRGAPPARITVRLLGGRLGNITSTVSGVPRFRSGEDVVMFLEPARDGNFQIVSWEQGTFRIHRDLQTNEDVITQDTAALPTFDPATREFATVGVKRQPVQIFRTRVEAALARETPRKP